MDSKRDVTSAEKIAEELACWAGSGAMIIDHMARCPRPDLAELSAPETLRKLIRDTLAPMADRYAAEDLAVAAEVLADAVETLGSEILLVDRDSLMDEEL